MAAPCTLALRASKIPHPVETREPRHATLGHLAVAIGDHRPDRWRIAPFVFVEAGSQHELDAVRRPHSQRAEHSGVLTFSRLMADDFGFRVVTVEEGTAACKKEKDKWAYLKEKIDHD